MDFKIRPEDEYIKLGQLLKACNIVSNGSDAKVMIAEGMVFVDGECETARGRKLKEGNTVRVEDKIINIIR